MMKSSGSLSPSNHRAALVIAHPGHELRIYNWVTVAQPTVLILTDGSGRSGISRLNSTTSLLEQIGGKPGHIYGRISDIALYQSILGQDLDFFIELAEEVCEFMVKEQIDYLAGDAIEGYNPAHDVCRLVINASLAIVKARYGRSPANFEFPLSGPPDACPAEIRDRAIWLHLTEEEYDQKVSAARNYPALLPEVQSTVSLNGLDAFRVECLRPVQTKCVGYILEEPPFYETYGEKQVAAGLYSQVLRYREHMLPLAHALQRHVKRAAS